MANRDSIDRTSSDVPGDFSAPPPERRSTDFNDVIPPLSEQTSYIDREGPQPTGGSDEGSIVYDTVLKSDVLHAQSEF